MSKYLHHFAGHNPDGRVEEVTNYMIRKFDVWIPSKIIFAGLNRAKKELGMQKFKFASMD